MRDPEGLLLISILMGAAAITAAITGGISQSAWERAAIRHNAAHYDSITGKWQWNDEPKAEASQP